MSKAKKTKVMTVEIPKTEAPAVDAVESIVAALTALQASAGWAIVVRIMNENIAYLEKAILEKKDPVTNLEVSDAEIEILRLKRGLNIELRDTPTEYTKVVREAGEIPTEYDPYFKTNDDIIEAAKRPVSDDKGSR